MLPTCVASSSLGVDKFDSMPWRGEFCVSSYGTSDVPVEKGSAVAIAETSSTRATSTRSLSVRRHDGEVDEKRVIYTINRECCDQVGAKKP